MQLWDCTGGSIGARCRPLGRDHRVDGAEMVDRRRLDATAADCAAEEHHNALAVQLAGARSRGLKRAQR